MKDNLGLCFLIKGEELTATEFYIEDITEFKKMKSTVLAKKYLDATIDDIDKAKRKYPGIKGIEDVRDLLRIEIKNYR